MPNRIVVCCACLNVVPLRDCVAPPFTSKVLKYIVETNEDFRNLRGLLGVRGSFKPIVFSPLWDGSRFLYSRRGDGGGFVRLRAGRVYGGRVSFIAPGDCVDVFVDEVLGFNGRFRTVYGEFSIGVSSIEVVGFDSLSFDFDGCFKVRFLTPIILTSKLMMPPPLRVYSRRVPERHRLIPTPSYIFNYLIRLWNAFAPDELKLPRPGSDVWAAYKFGRISDIVLVEVDYSVKPETVVYGKTSDGRLKLVRGFTGWIIYELIYPKLRPIYSKLLALAKYMGVGRSRSIGFGQVDVVRADKH